MHCDSQKWMWWKHDIDGEHIFSISQNKLKFIYECIIPIRNGNNLDKTIFILNSLFAFS